MNMAITMNGLKGLAGRVTGRSSKGHGDSTTMLMQTVRKLADKEPGRVPLIGHLPVERQYLYTGGALIVSLLLAAGFTIYSSVQLDNRTGYEARAGELEVLSQRLPLTAQQSVLGNAAAFPKLAEGKADFEKTLTALLEGDEDVPASRGAARDTLEKIGTQWEQFDPLVGQILSQQKNLVAMNENVKRINALSVDLQEVAEQLAGQLADAGTQRPVHPGLAGGGVLLGRQRAARGGVHRDAAGDRLVQADDLAQARLGVQVVGDVEVGQLGGACGQLAAHRLGVQPARGVRPLLAGFLHAAGGHQAQLDIGLDDHDAALHLERLAARVGGDGRPDLRIRRGNDARDQRERQQQGRERPTQETHRCPLCIMARRGGPESVPKSAVLAFQG